MEDMPSTDPIVDYTQILPIQQKRTIAFINHFVMNTVSFLNNFVQSCESRLMKFEYKLQKVEASLMILEAQLSSIAGLEDEETIETTKITDKKEDLEESPKENVQVQAETEKTSEDPKYQRFTKMLQFGVPLAAVKLKMQSEGLDPNILE